LFLYLFDSFYGHARSAFFRLLKEDEKIVTISFFFCFVPLDKEKFSCIAATRVRKKKYRRRPAYMQIADFNARAERAFLRAEEFFRRNTRYQRFGARYRPDFLDAWRAVDPYLTGILFQFTQWEQLAGRLV
jgi:hypothetical protein